MKTREQMVRELAAAIKGELVKNGQVYCTELPNEEATIMYNGKIDLLALAEWFYCRLG